MELEEWKNIEGYEGLYQAGHLGNIKSLARVITRSNGVIQTFKGRILKPALSAGYLAVALSEKGLIKTFHVHKLVANAFHGHSLSQGFLEVIDHFDGDIFNNRADNLKKVTSRFNTSKGHISKNNSSRYTGVRARTEGANNRYDVDIRLEGPKLCLGSFPFTQVGEVDASNTYQTALEKYESDKFYYKENIHQLSPREKREYLLK